MKLLELMEKNDQKKLQLLYYLDQHPNRKLKNSELQDKLQISYYPQFTIQVQHPDD
ncbi:hypothetical protein [Lacticaseibacillus paracasei]|uniref:hypothetical protein n=1 Tax=Lacticaseibacillus paracasei TaxID=1597 RepID=UPI0025A287FB|nr:hypothetical protein [Lacticaseibacillus paracasei]MDM7528025.1 hypothetical protein [Lacticaseibacillus paracasei]